MRYIGPSTFVEIRNIPMIFSSSLGMLLYAEVATPQTQKIKSIICLASLQPYFNPLKLAKSSFRVTRSLFWRYTSRPIKSHFLVLKISCFSPCPQKKPREDVKLSRPGFRIFPFVEAVSQALLHSASWPRVGMESPSTTVRLAYYGNCAPHKTIQRYALMDITLAVSMESENQSVKSVNPCVRSLVY